MRRMERRQRERLKVRAKVMAMVMVMKKKKMRKRKSKTMQVRNKEIMRIQKVLIKMMIENYNQNVNLKLCRKEYNIIQN